METRSPRVVRKRGGLERSPRGSKSPSLSLGHFQTRDFGVVGEKEQ